MKGSLKEKLETVAPWKIHTRGIGFLGVYLQLKVKIESDTPWTIYTRGITFLGFYASTMHYLLQWMDF